MKTKTLLTLLLALSTPVVSISFTPSFAPKEAKVTFADGGHIHEGNTFTAWSESDSLPGATGYYYLTSDVEISSTWTPAPNTYLCLNGYGIRLTGEGCVIQIAEGKSFNLFDCPFSGVQTHKYAIDETGLATVDDALAENYETFTGGYITGGNGSNGSGISLATGLSNSTTRLTMDGGTIIGNHTTTDGGGISYYWTSGMKGAISLSNATILGNVADKQGGGIFHQASNDKMEFKGKNVITRNVSGSAPAGVLEESLIYIQGDLHIEGNHLTNGNPSDLSVSHAWGQPDRLIVSGELAPTSRIGIDTLRRGQIEDYATYNDLDPNTILSSNSGDIYGIKDGKVVSNAMDEDIEITYDGEGHVPTVTLLDPSITYTIAYGLVEGTYDLDTPPTFTSAGDHRFYYEIVAGLNTRRGHIDVHIVKEDPVVTLAPTAVEDLAYTGEAQTLLVAGTATGGTMQYRIGEGEWSETLPTATSAGTYDVYYRVKGDDLHADLDPVLIQVTISANDKTALSSAINDAQDYLNSVQTAYGPLTGALEEEIENAAAVRDDVNKTIAEISDAVTNLNNVKGALVSAIAEVDDVKAKINGLDDVITLSSEDGIVAARTAYDALTDAQKSLVDAATLKKLTDAEAAFDGLKADQVVALIEAIGEVGLDKEDEILAARNGYDALTDAQKVLVDAAILQKLVDAEATLATMKADKSKADDVAGLINAIGEVTLEKGDEIFAARNAYDALSDAQKAYIDQATLKKLTDAEAAFDGLKADQVVALIEAIGEVGLDKEDEIVAARNGYDALTDAQKDLIDAETLKKLTDAETELVNIKADHAAADKVAGLINAIGEVTLDKEDEILAARAAYDALNDDQKALVDPATLQKLVDAEAALATMKADKSKADDVVALIDAIGEVTLEKESAIVAARNGYDALTDAQKAYIDQATLKKLTDAEATLATMKADKSKADEVAGLINGIGEVTLEKESAIVAAREAYDALSDAQKAYIDQVTLKKLTDAEAALVDIKTDKAAADAVIAQIDGIGEVTLDKEDEILAVRAAFDALTASQKDFVDAATLKKLTDAEATLATMKADKAAADDVVALIDAIGEVALDKEGEILAARAAYDALNDDQKALINAETLKILTDAEAALATMKADKSKADEVTGMINGIGDVTLEKESAIVSARAAFDALTDAQKAYVDAETLSKLTSAEVALASLKGDQAAAEKVSNLILGIGEVNLSKENTIVAARAAYDALNDDQKALINAETLKILTDAEAALAIMKADKSKADEVTGMINGIGDVTLEKESAIVAAREAYDALSDAQKAYIDQATLKKLTDAEGALAALKGDEAAVAYVEGLIDKIGEVTLEKENAIVTARNAYDALTDHQKELLSPVSLQKLVAAENALAEIKADKAEADRVRVIIHAIGEVTLSKEGAIVSAREAYEALSERAKSFLDEATLQSLIDAEATLAALKADKAAIDHVKELINSIGEVTLEKGSLIEEARAAYDALTDAQKERIPEYLVNILNSAEKILASLKADKAATDAFKSLVEDIGEIDDSEACRKRIEAAKSAYDSLSEEQKAAVASEYQTLLHMEASHNKMVSDKRLFTILIIAGIALGGVVALLLLLYAISFLLRRKFVIEPLSEKAMRVVVMKKKAGIATLLTPRLKKIYYPEDELYRNKKEALTAIAMSKAKREDVLDAIHAIGEVSLEKEEEICLARKSLDALPDQQKAKIDASDIRILEAAEETLTSLKAKASAKHVETLIRQISKEPEANPATIEMARKAYDVLSENEKSYLSSYSLAKLEEAEALLRDAPKEETKKKKDPKDEEE